MSLDSALSARSWLVEFVPRAAMWILETLTGGHVICRSCGDRVTPGLVASFVTDGCPACGSQKLRLQDGRVWRAVLVAVTPLLVLGLVVGLAPVGCDYPVYKQAAVAWMSGQSQLYDDAAPGFYYAPWSVPLFVALSRLPDKLGSGLINASSLAALFAAVYLLIGRAPWWSAVVAISNIWTANLLAASQWDALVVMAVALAYYAIRRRSPWLLGAAVAFAATKPTNVWLPLAVVALAAVVARWSWREWLTAAVIPSACVLLSFPIAGMSWPARYVDFLQATPPNAGYNATFWNSTNAIEGMAEVLAVVASVAALAVHIRRAGFDGVAVALGLVVNLMASPYVTIYHYVATIPAVVWLSRRDSLWLVLTYAVSVAWVIIRDPWLPLYPLAVAIAALVVELQNAHSTEATA